MQPVEWRGARGCLDRTCPESLMCLKSHSYSQPELVSNLEERAKPASEAPRNHLLDKSLLKHFLSILQCKRASKQEVHYKSKLQAGHELESGHCDKNFHSRNPEFEWMNAVINMNTQRQSSSDFSVSAFTQNQTYCEKKHHNTPRNSIHTVKYE